MDKGPLVGRIKHLIDAGLITKDFGKVLDHIREVLRGPATAADAALEPAGRADGPPPNQELSAEPK